MRVLAEPAPVIAVQKTRTRYNVVQLAILEQAFEQSIYIDLKTKVQLAQESQISPDQVKTWFGNRRYRLMHPTKADQLEQDPGMSNDQPEPRIGIKHRQPRTQFTESQLDILETAFSSEMYPNVEEREELARRTRLPENTVKVWCMNRRAQSRREAQR